MSAPKSHINGIFFGLTIAYFAAFQQFKLPVVLPEMLNLYGYDLTLAGGFMSIYAAVGLVLSLALGKAIERRGPIGLLYGAMVLFVVGNALALWRPESGMVVLLSRGLEGIAFSVLAIAGPVLANRNASPKALPLIIGLTATWIPVGQISATLLAPLALLHFDWRFLWWISIAGAVGLLLWTVCLRWRQPILLKAGTAKLEKSEAKTSPPAIDAEVTTYQKRALILGGAVFMLWSCQYFAYMTWLPEYLVDQHGLELTSALVGYLIPVVFVGLFCVLTGTLLRIGLALRWLLIVGLAGQVGCWLLLPFTNSASLGVFSLVLYGVSGGIVPTCLFALPSAIVGQGVSVARAFALVLTGRNIGVLAGPVLLAEAFKYFGGWGLAVPIFGGITAVAFCLALILAFRFDFAGFRGLLSSSRL
ncbi:MAG: MFS transporter [Pseudomonadota bacterium]